jgi:peroxiredoxin
MDSVLLFARLLLAATLLLAGAAKLADRAGSRKAIIDFGLPAALAPTLGLLVPVAELLTAVLLLPLATAWIGAIGAATLLLVFMGLIGYNLALGRRPECHCFGQIHSEPVGWLTMVRNVVLAALAGLVVWQGPERVGVSAFAWLGDLTIGEAVGLVLGVLGLAGVAALTWFLTQILAQQGRILTRLEALEARPAGGPVPTASPTTARNGTPAAPQGLPVGAPAPAFTLPDLEGRRTSLADLLAPRKPVLLLFVDPNCGPCSALLPEAANWPREHSDMFTLVLMSRGTPKDNRKKVAGNHGFRHVLLQEKYEVSERYSTLGTPSAVLVRPDGRMASFVAPGADAIKALVARTVASPASTPRPENAVTTPAVGASAPAIRLRGLDERWIELKHFRGHDTLVLFWNPGCGFCQRMREDLKAWEAKEEPGKPNLLVVSTGDVEPNRAENFKSPLALDPNFAVAKSFGAGGTPSAVLVDGEGRIASAVAVGAQAVFALAAPLELRLP